MKHQSITSLPASPDAERHGRMIKYSVAMGIRIVCIVLMLFAHGWWLLLFGAGAILLPYVAVVIANSTKNNSVMEVERPGSVLPTTQAEPETPEEPVDDTDQEPHE